MAYPSEEQVDRRSALVIAALLGAAAVAACTPPAGRAPGALPGGASSAVQPLAPDPPAVAAPDPASPFAAGQDWSGSYFCLQGETAAVLHVRAVEGLVVRAVIEFRAEGSGAAGSYEATGTYEKDARSIRLSPGAWIQRPEGYELIAMSGRVSASGLSLSGKVENPQCGELSLSLPGTDEH